MNTPDTEVEIEQNAETGEVITANGVRLTPGTEWTEALQVEVMDGYLHLAEMRHFAKDPVAHMEEMREHWQKLQDFISTLLSSRDTYWKERVRKKFIPWEKIEILDNGAIMTIDNKVRLYGFKRMTDPLMYEYDLRKGNQALDTLLDNLK